MQEKRMLMQKRIRVSLLVLVAVLFVFISGCAGVSRIDSFFNNQEYLQHAKLIDFGLFFVMFLALSYIGLSKVWGEGFGKPGASAKGPIVGLSIALALSLAFAIVTQTKFGITTIFPLAKAMFFLIFFFILWGLLVMSKMFGEHWGGKLVAAILAIIATYLLFSIFTHFVCQMSDNMSDPGCQSDFFNAFFTFIPRWLGIDTWELSSGGSSSSYSGGGGGGYVPDGGGGGTPIGPDIVVPTGPIQGGCRMDILFAKDSDVPMGGDFAGYAKFVKGKSVNLYGFASIEGEAKYNTNLATRRVNAVEKMLIGADSSIKTSTKTRGATTIFGSSLDDNRRVVIVTEATGNLAPFPGAGSPYNCTEPKEGGVCKEDKDCKDGQVCKDGKCVDKPAAGTACKEDKDCKEGETCKDGRCVSGAVGSTSKLWWLLAIIPLLLLLLAVKRKKRIDFKDAITMKDHFLQQLEKIRSQKELAWHSIVVATVDAPTFTQDHLKSKAQQLIESIDKYLIAKNWKTIKKLAEDYSKDLDRIPREAEAFGINNKTPVNAQHIKFIVKALKEMQRKHNKPDPILFYSRLTDVVATMLEANKVGKEFHDFFVLQMRLKKETEKFAKEEDKILVKLREVEYSTMFGKRFWGTRHIVSKRDPINDKRKFPYVTTKAEVEGPLQEKKVDSSSTYGIVEVTQDVRNLCRELLTKIQEVVDEENNVTHHVSSRAAFNVKYDEEKVIMSQLVEAIKLQKKLLSEEWWPVIDDIETALGKLEGHIHYRRY